MKMAFVAILAAVSFSTATAQAQLSGIFCAGKTLPPGSCADPEVCNSSNSYFYFTIDTTNNQPGPAGFRFHLFNGTGRVNGEEVPGVNVVRLDISRFAPGTGQAGEMKIDAALLNNFETVSLEINYDGNDFGGRIPVTAQTKEQKEQALMQLYLTLAQTGSFGHVSYDPLVPPTQLGGRIIGFAPWRGFQKTIDFRNTICARY